MPTSNHGRWARILISALSSTLLLWASATFLVTAANILPVTFTKQLTSGLPSTVDQFGTLVALDGGTAYIFALETTFTYRLYLPILGH